MTYIRHSRPGRPARREADGGIGRQRLTIPFVGRGTETDALVNAYRRVEQNSLQVMTLVGQELARPGWPTIFDLGGPARR